MSTGTSEKLTQIERKEKDFFFNGVEHLDSWRRNSLSLTLATKSLESLDNMQKNSVLEK